MTLDLYATRPAQRWASAWLEPFGIKELWLDPAEGVRALVLGGKAEAELDISARDGALVVRFAAARDKTKIIPGSPKAPAGLWWPKVRASIEEGAKVLPLPVSLAVRGEERELVITIAGTRCERVLILSERLFVEWGEA